MVKRALTEKRPWLLASIAAAIAYFFLKDTAIGGTWLIMLKGSAAALLSVYALQRHGSIDAKILAGVMILSAAGDMLIELDLIWGGAAFFLSHLAAITLYLKNKRQNPAQSQMLAAAALLALAPLVSWLLSQDLGIAMYGVALGGMAAAAWLSRFSRYRVGVGAILFVVSDWLIFAGTGNNDMPTWCAALVWPLYYLGQFLIATGVIQTLRKELPGSG